MNTLRYLLKGLLLFISIPLVMCKSTSLTENHTQKERSEQLSTQSVPSASMANEYPDSSAPNKLKQQELLNEQIKQAYERYRKEIEEKEAKFKKATIFQGAIIVVFCASQCIDTSKKPSSKRKSKTKKQAES